MLDRDHLRTVPGAQPGQEPGGGVAAADALDHGQVTDPSQVTRANEVRRRNDHELAALFGDVDVLVTPTTPQTAFPLGEYEANLPAGDLCWAFNLSGHPAVTVPAGLLDGLPVGLQAVAAPHRDDLAVELAWLAAVSLPDPPVRWPVPRG
jgi:Asp-tRNA(Asn)/Glu-tRNA(Gln) amidotransferase A subunit family amidase